MTYLDHSWIISCEAEIDQEARRTQKFHLQVEKSDGAEAFL